MKLLSDLIERVYLWLSWNVFWVRRYQREGV